jgi:flavorubredoxin
MYDLNDVNGTVLFEEGDHKFIWLGADPNAKQGVIQTNQFLIIDKGRGILLDPGGIHLFSRVVAAASRYISIEKIDTIFFSHQDPDVSSGIALWLGVTKAKIYVSKLWLRFLPHFGIVDSTRVLGIADTGGSLPFSSGGSLQFIPAHFLHSVGQFNTYDDRAKILFTGDIGASVFPEGSEYLYVDDFSAHVKYIDEFHKRYMASNAAIRKWVSMVEKHKTNILAPQHGALYRGPAVQSFYAWMSQLRCGIDLIDEIYGR